MSQNSAVNFKLAADNAAAESIMLAKSPLQHNSEVMRWQANSEASHCVREGRFSLVNNAKHRTTSAEAFYQGHLTPATTVDQFFQYVPKLFHAFDMASGHYRKRRRPVTEILEQQKDTMFAKA
ncbi:hypothetical protein PENCOP_c001G03718 [Penicillium coprophilum]|uniref:Uncharacterized protein n=1 Tax=Penicillium coprophilum TaxID=36646 RepID=A0A1V6V7G0_9EURO|nr:hypothetical protein PENCOP_c001G03718 [Penicillium coprophilum]